MKAFIVYCHPSEDSLTRNLRDEFIKGIIDSGNEYVLSDLYKMDFKADMTEQEYLRDANYRDYPEVASDVTPLNVNCVIFVVSLSGIVTVVIVGGVVSFVTVNFLLSFLAALPV